MPAGQGDSDRTRVFDALADPTRRQIVEHLSQTPEATISEIAGNFTISRQAVTKHLNVLVEAGVVSMTSRGRERIVSLRPDSLDSATTWLEEMGRRWDDRLRALRDHLEKDGAS
ncbi:MAG: ArsR/SmtB family transcription factor [Thermomicrobiales bacterium]